jgi:hypothetical protein
LTKDTGHPTSRQTKGFDNLPISPVKPQEETPQTQQPKPKKRLLKVSLGTVGSLASILAIFELVYSYRPQLSLSLGTPLNPHVGWTMNFNVVNAGKLSLEHVTARCDLEAVQAEHISVGGVSVTNGPPIIATVLAPGEQTTTYCPFLENFARKVNPGRTIYARISIVTAARLRLFPWKLKKSFRFELREPHGIPPDWEAIPNQYFAGDKD